VPRKIRQLIADLQDGGFQQVPGGKGSHRKFIHAKFQGFVLYQGTMATMLSVTRKNMFEMPCTK